MGFLPQVHEFNRDSHYFYGHYYAVQAMWHAGGEYWTKWYPAIRDALVARQADDGSWNDCDLHGIRHQHGLHHPADAQQLPADLPALAIDPWLRCYVCPARLRWRHGRPRRRAAESPLGGAGRRRAVSRRSWSGADAAWNAAVSPTAGRRTRDSCRPRPGLLGRAGRTGAAERRSFWPAAA